MNISTHFRILIFLAWDLRGLANIKVYFSFVNFSDSLGLELTTINKIESLRFQLNPSLHVLNTM